MRLLQAALSCAISTAKQVTATKNYIGTYIDFTCRNQALIEVVDL
jgi:hypothetical protein